MRSDSRLTALGKVFSGVTTFSLSHRVAWRDGNTAGAKFLPRGGRRFLHDMLRRPAWTGRALPRSEWPLPGHACGCSGSDLDRQRPGTSLPTVVAVREAQARLRSPVARTRSNRKSRPRGASAAMSGFDHVGIIAVEVLFAAESAGASPPGLSELNEFMEEQW